MAKMKVSEIAKSLNITNKELIVFLNQNGFTDVKSANKNIEDEAIALILKTFAPKMEQEKQDQQLKTEPVQEKTIKKQEEEIHKEIETVEKEKIESEKEEKNQKQIEKTEEKIEGKSELKNITSMENQKIVKREESKKEEFKKEQPKREEPKKEEFKKEQLKREESKKEEFKKEQSKREEPKKEEFKKEQSKREEPKKEEFKKEQPKREESRKEFHQKQDRRPVQRNTEHNEKRQSGSQGQRRQTTAQGQRPNYERKTTQRPNENNVYERKQGQQGQRNNEKSGTYGQRQGSDKYQNQRSNNSRNNHSANTIESSLSGFAASPVPTKNTSNRSNSYNKKNNERPERELRSNKKSKDPNRKGAFIMPKPVAVEQETEDTIKTIVIPETITVKELADKMKTQAAAIVKKLFMQGKMVSINQDLTFEEAEEIALEYNCIVELEKKVDIIEEILKEEEEEEHTLQKRSPVVCVMGHVDHGKTSLLDAIRETSVTAKEAGGITQHIGAYVVEVNREKITFLDTPGHEAFTSMRMRGAKSTDIAILVVAADDGVMPQTIEAINHAKAAGIEIIVAINKIDKPSANIERVKQELVEHELIAEDWGGNTVFVPVSAHTKEGIDQLLEMILLTAEVCELKANPNRKARGIVIEARLDKGRGSVATILVQKGTLHIGEPIVIGSSFGKVRAMMDDMGRRVKEAGPSTPVEILGLNEVPAAGEVVMATETEKEARSIADAYIKQGREKLLDDTKSKLSLDGLFSQIQAGNIKELNLIVKADVQGSVEAVKQSLQKLSNEEVAIRIIHGGVGNINESDVSLASASNAIIIGFNVKPDSTAKDIAEREKVDLRLYKVIYNAIEDIEAAMKGMLDPVYEEKIIGHAEVRQLFKASGLGVIAGSYVLDGKIQRGSMARITREGELIFDGNLASLKRFKDDVKEVATGYECGLVFEKFNDLKEEDQVEVYIMVEVPR